MLTTQHKKDILSWRSLCALPTQRWLLAGNWCWHLLAFSERVPANVCVPKEMHWWPSYKWSNMPCTSLQLAFCPVWPHAPEGHPCRGASLWFIQFHRCAVPLYRCTSIYWTHSPVERHLGCFRIFWVSQAILLQTFLVCIFWCTWARFSLGARLEEEWPALGVSWMHFYFIDHTSIKHPWAPDTM